VSETEQIEAQAADFLMRRAEPDWTEADQARLDAWLEQSMAHKAAFWRLEHGYAQLDRIAALGLAESRQPRRWARPLALAASVALVLLVGGLYFFRAAPWGIGGAEQAPIQYATNFGSIGKTVLPDGSRIELNAESDIRFTQSSSRRTLWLNRGEAYFDVARDERRPFTVHIGPRNVTVLGTQFVVARGTRAITVSVLDGRVRLDAAKSGAGVGSATLTAGQTAIAESTSTLIRSEGLQAIRNRLAWREGVLKFDQTTLRDAAAQFNRYNVKKLVVSDDDTAAIRIGGSFHVNNVEGFSRLLESAYGLRVENRNEEIVLSSP
jgi:transmembrane sensor